MHICIHMHTRDFYESFPFCTHVYVPGTWDVGWKAPKLVEPPLVHVVRIRSPLGGFVFESSP